VSNNTHPLKGLVVRAVQQSDGPAIAALLEQPKAFVSDHWGPKSSLEEHIKNSVLAFSLSEGESEALFLFVLEEAGEVSGVLGLSTLIGTTQPRYHFRAGKRVHQSHALSVYRDIDLLLLGNDCTGSTELCLFAVGQKSSLAVQGAALIEGVFEFARLNPNLLGQRLIAELPGLNGNSSKSEFWLGLGDRFIPQELKHESVGVLVELLPRTPIYLPFLSPEVRSVIGLVSCEQSDFRSFLESNGLYFQDMIRPEDGGGVLEVLWRQVIPEFNRTRNLNDRSETNSQAKFRFECS